MKTAFPRSGIFTRSGMQKGAFLSATILKKCHSFFVKYHDMPHGEEAIASF